MTFVGHEVRVMPEMLGNPTVTREEETARWARIRATKGARAVETPLPSEKSIAGIPLPGYSPPGFR